MSTFNFPRFRVHSLVDEHIFSFRDFYSHEEYAHLRRQRNWSRMAPIKYPATEMTPLFFDVCEYFPEEILREIAL